MSELLTFMAERKAAAMTPDDVGALHAALMASSARLSAMGERVEYVRSFYLAEQRRWCGVFAAEDPQIVRRAARIAQLSAVEVYRALECVQPTATVPRARGGKPVVERS